jgi:hypothetical protein
MNKLKLFAGSVFKLFKQVGSLPEFIAHVVKHRRQQTVLDEQEAERLDRIRNPGKYLGK